ncbi:MAG: hypothetical protein WA435_06105 [Gallionellaceae bacterium]
MDRALHYTSVGLYGDKNNWPECQASVTAYELATFSATCRPPR